jgi:hypothetical protein
MISIMQEPIVGLAFDNDLDLEVDGIEIEEDDLVFMAMVHLVNPQYFIHTSSTVSGHLAEASAENSNAKGFHETVLMALHSYADVFSETAFDTFPQHQKWDHSRAGAQALPRLQKGPTDDSDRAEGDGLILGGSTSNWLHQAVQVAIRSPCLLHQEEGWQTMLHAGLLHPQHHHTQELLPPPSH